MTGLHSLGMHASHMARHTDNGRVQAVLQWVGVGSIIMMGAGAAVHMYKELVHTPPAHKHRQMLDDLDRHYRQHEGHGRGR
jgi:hypothetical protein